MELCHLLLKIMRLLKNSIPGKSGPNASTPLGTSKSADLAGLSLLVKLSLTDSVSPPKETLMLYYLLKIWSSVTNLTSVAKEESFTLLGITWKQLVLSLTPVCLTTQALELLANAQQNAQVTKNSLNINVNQAQ